MGIYYKMPESTTLLIVTNIEFAPDNATYFNVTILNPSNSVSDANITGIQLSVEGKNETEEITDIDVYGAAGTELVEFPHTIRKGTEPKFRCNKNWSSFAGQTLGIEPMAANASTKSYSFVTPKVKLNLTPDFDASQTVEYFDLSVENSAEASINLTISDILLSSLPLNTTPGLPYNLTPNETRIFRCERNWEDLIGVNATITVKTSQGYESTYTTHELPGASIFADEITFDYTETSYFNLTVTSSEYSTATAEIIRVNLTLPDNKTLTLNTTPPLDIIPIPVPPNQSLPPIKCLWDWNTYRNETITVRVYTKQGYTPPVKTEITPPDIVFNITDVKFDFDDTEHFTLNLTNMPCSLHEINVTKILLDDNETIVGPPIDIRPGEQRTFNCTLPWKNWIGKDGIIKVLTDRGLNVSRTVTLPAVGLKLLGDDLAFGDLRDLYAQALNITIPTNVTGSIPYVNITISNSINSLQSVNITKMVFQTENKTYEIDATLTYPKMAPNGYTLRTGEIITVICLSDWTQYSASKSIKVTVYTAEGIQISRTWYP